MRSTEGIHIYTLEQVYKGGEGEVKEMHLGKRDGHVDYVQNMVLNRTVYRRIRHLPLPLSRKKTKKKGTKRRTM